MKTGQCRWESLAQEWITILEIHDDDTVTAKYPDGAKLRVGTWILYSYEW